jgi:hypothetical protein
MTRPESGPRYDEQRLLPINPWLPDIPSSTPTELLSELMSGHGEGYLMRQTDPQVLLTDLMQVMRISPSQGRLSTRLVMDAASFAINIHKSQRRKDKTTPYAVHPLRVTLRLALHNNVDDISIAIALLHDAEEDQGITEADIVKHFHVIGGHSLEDAKKIYLGIHVLNNEKRRKGREMSQSQFFHSINRANTADPERGYWLIKGEDRYDNFLDDLTFSMQHRGEKEAADRINHYLWKINGSLVYVKRHEPNTSIVGRTEIATGLGTILAEEYKPPTGAVTLYHH